MFIEHEKRLIEKNYRENFESSDILSFFHKDDPECQVVVSEKDKRSPQYIEGISCPHCFESLSDEQCKRAAQRQKQIEISQKLHRKHIGMTAEERAAWREEKLEKRRPKRGL